MSKDRIEAWESVFRLVRFLFWYTSAAVAFLVLLPWAGTELQARYDALSSGARILSISGLVAAIAVWQLIGMRDRAKGASALNHELGDDAG